MTDIFHIFPEKQALTFPDNCHLRRHLSLISRKKIFQNMSAFFPKMLTIKTQYDYV